MDDKKLLAMYIRLSVEDGDLKSSGGKTESNSISNQRKLLLAYYKAHLADEYDVLEFCDDGFSGTNFNRPQFQNMMNMVRQRKVHCVIVKDLSRFGRDYLEASGYLELIFPLYRTRFISVNDSFDSEDYIGTTGGTELALRNLINGMYSKDLSIKVRSAIRARNRQGQYYGGFSFYGYLRHPGDKHKLIIDESVRHIIVRIFEECVSGKTLVQIAAGLNKDGVLSPSAYKAVMGQKYNGRRVENKTIWQNSMIRQILSDERYTGKMVSGKHEAIGIRSGKIRTLPEEKWIVVRNTHEAIISEELFAAAVEARKSRIRTVNSNTAGLRAGNLFVCGYCGRKLQKSNGKRPYLYCPKYKNDNSAICSCIHEPVKELQSNTLAVIRLFIKTMTEQLIRKQAEAEKNKPVIEQEIRNMQECIHRIQNGKLDLYEKYRNGQITRNQFSIIQRENAEKVETLKAAVNEKESRLEALKSEVKRSADERNRMQGIRRLSEYKPEAISRVIERVRVFDGGRIELELKSKDPVNLV